MQTRGFGAALMKHVEGPDLACFFCGLRVWKAGPGLSGMLATGFPGSKLSHQGCQEHGGGGLGCAPTMAGDA